jgi:BlaI family penicillinase repressor
MLMKKLTKAEEEVMHIIWELERCLVSDVLDYMAKQMDIKKPPHSTISSIVRILEKKGFVDHKAYGRTYEYFPIVSKEAYSKSRVQNLVSDYFEGSPRQLVSFLIKEKNLSVKELSELVNLLDQSSEEE